MSTVIHKDRTGRELKIRDIVAYGGGNGYLGIGPVLKFNEKTVRIGGGGNNYSNQTLIINEQLMGSDEGIKLSQKLIKDYETHFDTSTAVIKVSSKWCYGVLVCCDAQIVTDESQVSVHIVKFRCNDDFDYSASYNTWRTAHPQYFQQHQKVFYSLHPSGRSGYRNSHPHRICGSGYSGNHFGRLLLRELKEAGFQSYIGQTLTWAETKAICAAHAVKVEFDPLVSKQQN